MFDTYHMLLSTKYFLDNEFLLKYCQVVDRNKGIKHLNHNTHKHHILPVSWFKLTNSVVNNELNNLVRLPVRDHFMAHYYLCLCTEDPFKYANQLALMCLESNKRIKQFDKELLHRLPMYNNIYEDLNIKLKNNYRLYS